MKISAAISVFCFLVVLNGAQVESWLSSNYRLFVFGDSFADTGNIPRSHLSPVSRQWYYPYGSTTGLKTGRFSDGSVQTDFIAEIVLGRYRVPPMTYRVARTFGDPKGMDFAHGGAGVFEVPSKAPTLSKQIHYFKELFEGGVIHRWQLKQSVALVAISGNDYAIAANMSGENDIQSLVGNVTSEIAKGVMRLRKMGMTKVLVNNLHPMGCTPWLTRPLNYTKCDAKGNMAADLHNNQLKNKLADVARSVYVIDLNKAFSRIVNPSDPSKSAPVAQDFTHKLKPCCRSYDPNGYCGQVDDDGKRQYSVCHNPDNHFYWDDAHASESGWDAVMGQLQAEIQDFL